MWYLTAIVMGLAGSLHCAGMCGPLALALPGRGAWRQLLGGRLLYNIGRTVTYSLMGAIVGLLGFGLAASPLQQYLSVLSGVVILLLLLFSATLERAGSGPLGRLSFAVRSRLGRLLGSRPGLAGQFAIGLVNGLLPCGLVYAALAGAAGTGGVGSGMLFMALFGLGTLPMMLALSLAGRRLFSIPGARRLVRISTVAIALLLIIRGLNLGIPYVSPQIVQARQGEEPQVKCGGSCCQLKRID
ncbi:MAG: sulfite exporter TauE/SafE family protein [Bacteroidetes bacterium]|nr:sulfite exporter TauE/SafE family protein [Bacteroidota bacterium]